MYKIFTKKYIHVCIIKQYFNTVSMNERKLHIFCEVFTFLTKNLQDFEKLNKSYCRIKKHQSTCVRTCLLTINRFK